MKYIIIYLNGLKEYDQDFYELITKYEEYTKNILNIEREQKKPRKRLC